MECGSFTNVTVICFLVDCGCFTSMTAIYFLERTLGPSPMWTWSIFLVDYVSFSSMTMICFLGWTVGPSLAWPWGDHEPVFLCGLWGLPQCDSEFHFMGGLCFFKHDCAKYAYVSLQYVTASFRNMNVCPLSTWLYWVWMCLLTKNSGSVCCQYSYSLTLSGSLSRYINCLSRLTCPFGGKIKYENMSIWLIQILVMIIYWWYLLYITLSCCYYTWHLMILEDQL